MATCRKTPRAVFKQNEDIEMQNNHIMALALRLNNAKGVDEGVRGVRIPALTGKQLRQLLAWLEVLK